MIRSAVGAALGAAGGFAAGCAADHFGYDGPSLRTAPSHALLYGAILGAGGAAAGAIVGGVADILKYLRDALPVRHGPEADYREPRPPAP